MGVDRTRRAVFDEAALDYDRYRPGYPPEAIADLVSLSGVGMQSRLLEIGCGTGKATVPLAQRGLRIDAVELGEKLAAVAAANCRPWPRVSMATGDFESLEIAPAQYDLIYAAQAFHWIEADVRLSRCWELLRPEGFLALLYNYKPLRPGAALARLAEVIERESGGRMRQSDYRDEVARWTKELEDSPFFTGLSVRRYPWAGRYTTAEYLGLFRTYSDYRSLPADAERRVAAAIQDAIDRNGGSVAVDYECVLFLTRKAREEQPTI